jgi:Holliday junction resolvase-like predicted endonuclease
MRTNDNRPGPLKPAPLPERQAAFRLGISAESRVFAEVKARASLAEAAESVDERQRRRIAAAAEVWLAANPDKTIFDIRFDAILVAPGKIPRHIPAAFEAG